MQRKPVVRRRLAAGIDPFATGVALVDEALAGLAAQVEIGADEAIWHDRIRQVEDQATVVQVTNAVPQA